MENKKPLKNPKKYVCGSCNFSSSNKKDYNRHIQTRKHKEEINGNEGKIKIPLCENCNKTFKTESGLWKHKKNCKAILKNELREPEKVVEGGVPDISKMITPDMIMTLLTQNQEFKELIVEQHQEMTKLQNKLLEREDKLLEVAKEGKTLFD